MIFKPQPATPAQRDLVLVGGGHAHLGVLRAFAMKPEPGLRITLVAKELTAPYSGMLPGYVAGVYRREDCHIDLLPLAIAAGARLIHGEATGLDTNAGRLRLKGRPDLGFDLLSLNVGVTPNLSGVADPAGSLIAVKPVSSFAERWEALRAAAARPGGPRRVAVIGGGAAGFELVLATARRLRAEAAAADLSPEDFAFTLISGGALLEGFAPRAQLLARAALAKAGVAVIENDPARAADPEHITLASGAAVSADAALIAAQAEAPPWLRETGLALDESGFVAVSPTLQSLSHGQVFAAGDCAGVQGFPRPKAGVFAVRQGMPLARNLRRAARGAALRPFRPQNRFLSLLSTADGGAIAARGDWATSGRWVWRWKDRIDRAFMAKHRPKPMSAATTPESEAAMRCGGCAAKVGPATLQAALARLQTARTRSGDPPPMDDAAVLETPGGELVRLESVDFFRAFWPDPWLFGRIAANHALGDIYAMGARPETAQAIAMLPYAKPHLVEEDLFQMTAGAQSLLEREGAALVGGHSSEGAEMALGFAVSGHADPAALLRKGGLRAGDRLILTRPIGSGVLMAASMRGLARGPSVMAALDQMQRSHAEAARILSKYGAKAATDVTGFGLAGHLLEMLEAAGLGAEITLGAVPLYDQALALAEEGVASTLLEQNLKLSGEIADPLGAALSRAALTLLLDPQTAGPLLAGVAESEAEPCLAHLRESGAAKAALIGRVTAEQPGAARLRVSGAFSATTPDSDPD